MIIDFESMDVTILPEFKGGKKEFAANMFFDGTNRIFKGRLIPGASIGMHTHDDSCEVLFVLEGKGTVVEKEAGAEAETVKVVSKAGESEAQTGLIVSFADGDSSTFLNSKSFFWLEAHAIEYGFVLRYPKNKQDVTSKNYNPQCYRFVGKEYAEKMKIYGLTLEEYKEYLGK